jgi:putative MATE family efflux protein
MITDMTEGAPSKILWRFTIPMLVSVMFQQFYNIADSVVAGKFVGVKALAAVGASYSITMIFMAVATGMNIGCSIVISLYFGAKEYKQMKCAISTSLVMVLGSSVILTILGLMFSRPLMVLLKTPKDIFKDSSIFLNIYICGLFFLFLYNICTGIFTALGDSRTPLYFLIISSVGNIALDLLFVIKFHMGVSGVAWATFLAQGASSVMVFITLRSRLKKIECGNYQRFSLQMLNKIMKMAIPSILQQSFISVGNLFVQGAINSYGSAVVAGYSAGMKINTFAIMSFTTLGNGVSNFTAQNMGARKTERVTKGFWSGITLVLCVAVPVFLLFFFEGRPIVNLFMGEDSEKAASVGVEFLKIVSPFYVVISAKIIADGVLRGAGAMSAFMISTFSDLILRVVLAFVLTLFWQVKGIWMSWPIGWVIGSSVSLAFYFSGIWKKRQVI